MILLKNKRMSLGTQFMAVFSFFLIVIMFTGAFCLSNRQKNTIASFVYQKGESISNIVAKMAERLIISENIEELDIIAKAVLKDKEIMYVVVQGPEGNILNSFDRALNIPKEEFDSFGIDPVNEKASLSNLSNNKDILSFETSIMGAGNKGKIRIGLSKKKVDDEARSSLTLMIIVTILVIIVTSFLLHTMFSNLVIKPLKKVIEVSKSISQGDLREHLQFKKDNEISLVANTINEMGSNLQTMVISIKDLFSELDATGKTANERSSNISTDINRSSTLIQQVATSIEHNAATLRELSTQTNELKLSSEDTSASILELVSSSGEISGNMDILVEEVDGVTSALEQISSSLSTLVEVVDMVSESTAETSSSTGEMMASVKQIKDLTENSRKLIVNVKQQTEESGLPSINETIEGMKNIRDSVELTGEVISILDSKSMEIDKILNVIDEVADRTTLLSLNAAILAAQAGKHGRSFAVVASEIKNLASDTSSSTQEISDIINMIQREIKTAVQSMGSGIAKVSDGFKLAEEAGTIFSEITLSTQKSSDYSEKIHTATQEQSEGINVIAQAIQSIEERIGGLLTFVKEQKEAMEKMLFSIKKMRDVAHRVKNSTDEQKRASAEISESADDVSSMSSAIAIALKVLSDRSSELIETVEFIKQNAKDNVTATTDMSQSVKDLLKKASDLEEKIDRFHV
jgi:methyl-accepting chemotaxis protein